MNSKVRIVLYIFLSLLLELSVGVILWCIGIDTITIVKAIATIFLLLLVAFIVPTMLNAFGVIGKKEQ